MIFVGCDIGLKGYFAALSDKSDIVWHRPMPLVKNKFCAHATWDLLQEINDFAVDEFETISIGIERPLSLPSDTNKVRCLVESLEVKLNLNDGKQREATKEDFEDIYKELSKTDGRAGTLTMGANYGILLGQIAAMSWRYQIIHPRTWQKVVHENTSGKIPAKQRSLNSAKSLWPNESFVLPRCRKVNDGFVDAVLIAEYMRRRLK